MDFKKRYEELLIKNVLNSDKNRMLPSFLNSSSSMFQLLELVYDDAGKVVDYYYREVNNTFLKNARMPRNEIIDRTVKEIFNTVEDHWLESLEKIIKSGESMVIEKYSEERKKYFEVLAWKAGENEIASIFRDITKQKKNELLLQESIKEIRTLNSSKERLLSIIAHELRSPFNVMLGFSNLLIDNATHKENLEDTLTYSKILNLKAKETLVLLDNLLDWGRSHNQYTNFNAKKIAINTIISDVVQSQLANATLKNVSLHFVLGENINIMVDQIMLTSILRNLIINAIKFTNAKGEVVISAKQVKSFCEISVSDNGVGISLDRQADLFNIETNSTTKGTEKEKGTGLGLLICKEFVEKNQGEISLRSSSSEGSNFMFKLPLFATS